MLQTFPIPQGVSVPTRRVFEMTVITVLLLHPVLGLARLWAAKTLAETRPGSVVHGAAEIVTVLS